MKKIEAAYIAGLMDGEGCFYIERFKSARSPIGFQYRVIATITMCDKRTIEHVCNITGKSYRTRKLKSGRIAYTIDWRSGVAGDLLKAIIPFLQNKKEQAEICLHFDKSVAPGRGRTYTKDHADICERLRLKLQSLKR
ncbi:MAG: 2 protein [Pseudomonadota bacterium]|nr:2 protein [Pseudomonadota bacterium]